MTSINHADTGVKQANVKLEKEGLPYTIVFNEVLYRKDVSLKAKGLYAYLFSKPNGWEFSADRISRECLEGRKSVLGALVELEESGLLERQRMMTGKVNYRLCHKKKSQSPNMGLGVKKPKSPFGTVQKRHGAETGLISNTEGESNTERIQSKTDMRDASPSPSSKLKKAPEEPMNLEQFIAWLEKSGQRHMQVIGMYALTKKPDFTTKSQWQQFIRRSLRSAKNMSPFSDAQIGTAFKRMSGQEYITRWTLETVEKFLTE